MSSDEEWEEEAPAWKGVTGTVVLINAFDPINSNVPGYAFKAASELVRHYMRTATSQLLGICIYGIESTNDNNEDFIQVFPLTVPTLDNFKALQEINIRSLSQAKEFKLSAVLWQASKMFTNCKKLLSYKSVILLTRMDIPPINMDQKPALKRVVDLVDSGIGIKIVNISETSYYSDRFYKNFLIEAHKGADYDEPPCVWGLSDIMKSIQKYTHRHLAVASLNLQIDHDFSIGVGIFNLLQTRTRPKKVIADKETNQILSKVTTTTKVQFDNSENESNGNEIEGSTTSTKVPLLKSELIYYQIFGNESIEFTVDEMKKLRNPFGPPMLKLLGFKPASLLSKEKWYLKPCYFLYPNENHIEGSTVAFKALYQACKETSVIAICVLCSRVNAKPKLVALLPCEHPLGLDVTMGFDVIHIPFDENVKNVPKNEDCDKNPGEAHKAVINDIVKGLIFDYKPDVFENPSIQSLHRAIEALALDQEDLQPYLDTTKPDSNKLKTIDAPLFEEIFGRFGATAAAKRPASPYPREKNKKERIEGDDEIDECLLSSRLSMKNVEKYNVTELKKILKSKGIPNLPALNGVKKNELVRLVYENVD